MAEYPGFIGPAYRSQSISAAGDELRNLYPEILESQGASRAVFYGTPGLQVFCVLPTVPVRGETYLDGVMFAVGGNILYQINSDGSIRQCAPGVVLPAGTSPVSMQTDGNFCVIAASGQLWVYSIIGDTLLRVPTDAVPGAGTISYADGYFIANVPGTNKFFISSLFDASTWNALDFGVKSGFPDIVIGQIMDHRELWLAGSRTMEIYWNTGNPNFPWERIQGPFIEAGLGAANSFARIDNTHFWLSEDERGGRMIWKANGYTPQRISTFAIEYALKTYARVDDAISYTYQELGHAFYVISFPSAVVPGAQWRWDQPGIRWDEPGVNWDQTSTNRIGATWVYGVSSNLWHQRDYLDPQFGISQQVRGHVHVFAFGLHLVGDHENGNIYIQSVDIYTDNVTAGKVTRIRRLRRAPHIQKEHLRVFYPGFELHIQQGVVPQDGDGSNPQFSLRKSGDGGYTWSPYLQAQAGLVGEYKKRLRWLRLGNARDAVFEVSSDEPIQHAWINAYLFPKPEVSAY